MKNTIANIRMGRGKAASCLLAVFFAFAGAETAQAAGRNWKGDGSDTLWSTSGNWDTVPTSADGLVFRESNPPNKTATVDGTYTYNGNIHMGAGSSAANPYIFESNDPANVLTIKDDTWLGYYENGWLWIKSGTYVFNGTSGKNFHVGEGKGTTRNFWLRIGDGASDVSVTTKGNVYIRGGSTFIADKATLDCTNVTFEQNETSSSYFTNTTMTAYALNLFTKSSATVSNSTWTISRDINVASGTGANCTLKAVSSTVHQTGSGYVFNVGHGGSSTGFVEKVSGDWDCYYLRVGNGANSIGTFNMNGGTLTVKTELGIGKGSGSTGVFNLNGGTVKAKRVLVNSAPALSELVVDGGTFQANGTNGAWIDSPVVVKIGENGGTIHTDGGNVTIAAAVNAVPGTAGSFTVTGGGSATFSAPGNLTGAFAIGENTALHWFDQDGTVADYPISSISIAPGATLFLDADATGCDTFGAATTNITATSANPATIALVFASAAPAGTTYTLFDTVDGSEFEVKPMLGALELPHEVSVVNGKLTLTITAEDYTWNGSQTNWGDADAWTKGGASATWTPGNNAIFDTDGREAVLAADAAASEVRFTANATVSGGSTLVASKVDVASGVTATISAPIGSAVSKAGAGTLVLGTNRTEQTTVAEGMLTLACTNAIDWTKLTLGTDAAKPVTLRFAEDATLAAMPSIWQIGNTANITSTVVKAGGDWTAGGVYVACAEGADTTFVHEGGTLTLTSTVDIGRSSSAAHALFDIVGGSVVHTGYVHSAANSPATVTVRAGAKYETATAQSYGFIVSGNANGTLNVQGGEMTVLGPLNLCYRGGNAEVNVTDGGTLSINKVQLNGGGGSSGTAVLTLDGGTIRANENNNTFIPDSANLTVVVGARGGTIDANSKTITLLKPILEDAESTGGGMTFKGGAKVTLAAGNTYKGGTTVELGTTVLVAAPGGIGGGLAVTVPENAPADGVYTLVAINGAGTFDASILTGVVPPANAALRLSADGKSVICVYGNPPNTWIGGAMGSLSDAANWSLGVIPQSGDSCVIGNVAAANLTEGDTFAPSAITFPADTALVTISGERTLTGLASIVNNSSQHHVLAFPVDASASTPTLPLADGNYLVFSGGIALNSMPSVAYMRLAGVWNLTGDWNEPPTGTLIVAGSTVTVSGMLKSGYNIVVQENATLQVATAKANLGANGKNRFLYQNCGTFIVTGEMQDTILSSGVTSYSIAGFFAYGNNGAVTRANGLVHAASTKDAHMFRLNNNGNSATNTIVLGSGGLSFRNNRDTNSSCYPYFKIDSDKAVTLASSADWSFGANSVPDKDLCLELAGSVTVDTSDYDDNTIAHTVRAVGRIGSGGKMTVTGCGRLVFEHYSDFYNLYVQGTATVACNDECSLTRTAVDVASDATFEVAQSGMVALGGNMTLADNATLAFNFTKRDMVPMLDVTNRTVTAGGTVKVKVSADDNIYPSGSANVLILTSGGSFTNIVSIVLDETDKPDWAKDVRIVDGNIVLDIKPIGFKFFVK